MDVFSHDAPKCDYNTFKAAMHEAAANPAWRSANTIQHQRWNPYSMEGG